MNIWAQKKKQNEILRDMPELLAYHDAGSKTNEQKNLKRALLKVFKNATQNEPIQGTTAAMRTISL